MWGIFDSKQQEQNPEAFDRQTAAERLICNMPISTGSESLLCMIHAVLYAADHDEFTFRELCTDLRETMHISRERIRRSILLFITEAWAVKLISGDTRPVPEEYLKSLAKRLLAEEAAAKKQTHL